MPSHYRLHIRAVVKICTLRRQYEAELAAMIHVEGHYRHMKCHMTNRHDLRLREMKVIKKHSKAVVTRINEIEAFLLHIAYYYYTKKNSIVFRRGNAIEVMKLRTIVNRVISDLLIIIVNKIYIRLKFDVNVVIVNEW